MEISNIFVTQDAFSFEKALSHRVKRRYWSYSSLIRHQVALSLFQLSEQHSRYLLRKTQIVIKLYAFASWLCSEENHLFTCLTLKNSRPEHAILKISELVPRFAVVWKGFGFIKVVSHFHATVDVLFCWNWFIYCLEFIVPSAWYQLWETPML